MAVTYEEFDQYEVPFKRGSGAERGLILRLTVEQESSGNASGGASSKLSISQNLIPLLREHHPSMICTAKCIGN